ncbi:MAG: RelA/SpoT family protein [Prolixibacteraceae bacterium]|nr:RelA/SpoT family protein [Prolixibacteraceae bacterium]HOS00532.1 RelA/SpoT family protein [Prolixibacteraceae bacterium]HPL45747.1 RelA/SpoT family protein [Prolixibacteraceae bacterium]
MSLFTKAEIRQINDCYDDLKREIGKRFDAERMEKVGKAFLFANAAHDGIRRKSGEPYIIHPIAVATVVARDLGLGATSVIAAILHDVVEDTDYSTEDIRNLFGENVARIVDGLTKLSGEMDTRQALTLKKMLMTLSDDVRVILIKLADRLHNMRTLESLPPLKQLKVSGETLYLYAPLAHRLGLYAIKNELEELSFKFKHPEDYKHLLYQLHDQEEKRNYLVNEFIAPIQLRLAEEGIECTVTHRLKSMFSIWTKMHTKGVTFDEVYDLLAIRIILKAKPNISEKRQCFEVLSLVTDIYPPKPDRIRDWITMPRANGYESLHVTVMGPQGKWVEVQIRTERMDQIAEYGFAAHYRYKDAPAPENELDRWIERIRDHLENSEYDAFEFLDEFKLDLFASEIVVFTPKGKTIKLPKGATVIDVAYEIHTNLGNKCIGAKINQKLVPPSHVLQNGDQVEILTSENQIPQQQWLSFITTAKAKSKVKNALRSEKKQHLEAGRELVEEAIKKHKAPLVANTIKKIIAHYNLNNKEQLFSEVGMGIIQLDDLGKILSLKSRNKFIKYWNITFRGKDKGIEIPGEEEPGEDATGLLDKQKPFLLKENPDKIAYSLAKCCNPIPGDDVIGYISSGDHVIIHKKICPKAEKLVASRSDKIITAEWTKFKKLSYLTRLNLNGFDRIGLVNDITTIISKLHSINMRSVKFDTHDGLFEGDLFLYIHNTEDLNILIGELAKVKGINKVTRVENLND